MTESDYFMPRGANPNIHPVSPTNKVSLMDTSMFHEPTDIDLTGIAAPTSTYSGITYESPLPPNGMRTNTSSTISTAGGNNNRQSPLQTDSLLNYLKAHGMENSEDISLLIRNVPQDVTLREVYCIFALALSVKTIELITTAELKDIIKEDLTNSPEDSNAKVIRATFEDKQNLLKFSTSLMEKPDVFETGNGNSKLILQIYDSSQAKLINLVDIILNSGLSTGGQNQQNYHFSNANSIVGIDQSSPLPSVNKRPSMMQKSRFSFGDPFTTEGVEQHLIPTADPSNSSGLKIDGHGIQQSHSKDTGKALLLMENDEINDSIWGTNNLPSTVDELPISGMGTQSLGETEWMNSALSTTNEYYIPPTSTSSNIRTNSIPRQSSQDQFSQIPQGGMDHINGANNLNLTGPNSNMMSSNMGMSMNQTPSFNSLSQIPQSQGSNIINTAPGNYRNEILMHDNSSTLNNASGTAIVNGISLQTNAMNNASIQKNINNRAMNTTRSVATKGPPPRRSSSLAPNSSTNNSQSNIVNSNTISQADLSLLAKVPPPANPADQNPPCNTLYVGNLPPDATEQELRQLFSSQPGFRRLSFRNKNNNSHGHGPMCFVEFDDVSYATRALAELYGSQLPRANSSSKGGIRLSFSKNPLGVRSSNNKKNLSSIGSSYNYSPNFVKN